MSMTFPAYRLDVIARAGTVSEATAPNTGSMITSTMTTTRNMTRLARVSGISAKMSRTCERSDEALAISWPVEVWS